MTLDAKRAPADTALDDATAKENIDVVETHAQDYSGAIQVEQQRAEIMPDIFIPLIDMEEQGIDVNEAKKEAIFTIDSNKDALTDAEYEAAYKKLNNARVAQRTFDAHVNLTEQWALKQQWAQQNGYDEHTAFQELINEYTPEKLFPDSQLTRDMWKQNYFDPFYNQTNAETIQNDLKAAQAKATNSLATAESLMGSDIAKGKDPATAVMNTMRSTELIRAQFSAADNVKIMNQLYNRAWQVYAEKLVSEATPANYSKVANSLKGILDKNSKKVVNAIGTDGKPIINPKTKKQEKVTLTLSPDMINNIMSNIGTLKDKARIESRRGSTVGGGGFSGSSVVSAIDNAMGYTAYYKSGNIDGPIFTSSPDDVNHVYTNAIQSVQNSNMSDKQKARAISKLSQHGAEAVAIATYIKRTTNGAKTLQEVKQRIASGAPLYQPAGEVAKSILKGMMKGGLGGGFKEANNALAISRINGAARKILNSNNADLIRVVSPGVRNIEDKIAKIAIANGSTKQGREQIRSLLQERQQEIRRLLPGEKLSNTKGTSTFLINSLAEEYKNKTGEERYAFLTNISGALIKSGNADVVSSNVALSNLNNDTKDFMKDVQTQINIQLGASSVVRNAMDEQARAGRTFSQISADIKAAHDENQSIPTIETESARLREFCDKRSVPLQHIEAAVMAGNQAYAYTYASTHDAAQAEKEAQKMIENLFPKLDSKYVKDAVYIGSSVFESGKATQEELNALNDQANAIGNSLEDVKHGYLKHGLFERNAFQLALNADGTWDVYDGGNRIQYVGADGRTTTLTSIDINTIDGADKLTNEQKNQYIASQVSASYQAYKLATDPILAEKYVYDIGRKGLIGRKLGLGEKAESGTISEVQRYNALVFEGLQHPDFMSTYIAIQSDSNLKFRVNEALPYDFGTKAGQDETRNMLNIAYNLTAANNKVNTVENLQLSKSIERGDTGYSDIIAVGRSKGFNVIPSDTRALGLRTIQKGINKISGTSLSKFSFDIRLYDNNNYENRDFFGGWSERATQNMHEMFKNNIKYLSNVETGSKTILDACKDLKTSDGKPLVTYNEKLQGTVRMHSSDPTGKAKAIAFETRVNTLAEDALETQSRWLPTLNKNLIGSILNANNDLFDKVIGKTFGVANLSREEYESYGLKGDQVYSKQLQARVATNMMQRLMQKTKGDQDLVRWGMAGGKYRLTIYNLNGKVLKERIIDRTELLGTSLDYYAKNYEGHAVDAAANTYMLRPYRPSNLKNDQYYGKTYNDVYNRYTASKKYIED